MPARSASVGALTLAAALASCSPASQNGAAPPSAAPGLEAEREAMVRHIESYGGGRRVTDRRVLAAMRKVPRHLFVPPEVVPSAYDDGPQPIGHGQTISQPFIVAFMTQALAPRPSDRVLEIGTGSGYQAAVLAELVSEVDTIEIVEPLARGAEATLARLGYKNVFVKAGDGYRGWPERAPYDAIIVTCAPERVPKPLVEQLKVGGRLVIPVGPQAGPWTVQKLYLLRKTAAGVETEDILDVRFVPMVGEVKSRRE